MNSPPPEKLHILHVLFTEMEGGLEQVYVNLTEMLSGKGHKVTALMRAKAPYRADVAAHAAEVITAEPWGFYDLITIWKLRALLKRIRPDIILAHNGRAIALLASAAKGLGIPVCGVSHSHKTRHAGRADRLFLLSDYMKEHFRKAGYTQPIEVIANAIRLPDTMPLHARHQPVAIGAIGRFAPEKGFDLLLEASAQLQQEGLAFTLHLAGDGPQKIELETLAQKLGLANSIRWHGWVKDKDAFYRQLDILCMPSRDDYFPLVALEAFANALPFIASDVPGLRGLLTNNINALVVPIGDVPALTTALRRLINEQEMAARLAEGAWQRIQDFGFEAIATRWDEALKNVL